MSAVAAKPVDTAVTKAAVLAADQALADRAQKDGPKTFLESLDPSAAVLFPGQPILRGRAKSEKAFMARYASPSSYSWRPVHAVASTDGRFGCTMGFSRFTNASDTAHVDKKGTYLTCWQLGADHKWPAFAKLGFLPDGPGPAFVHYAASDAVMLGGSQFPHGLTGIAAAFDGFPADQVIRWDPMRSFGAGSGGLVYTAGYSTSGPRDKKAGPAQLNKYMTVWRQNPDGRWVYIFDLGTSRM